MEGLLTPVSTSYKVHVKPEEDALVEAPKPRKPISRLSFNASTPEEALEILRNEPDHDALASTLHFLWYNRSDFSITTPSPVTAQLVHVLVSDTVPSYWNVLREAPKTKDLKRGKEHNSFELLLACLRSVAGLKAIALSLKQHIQLSRANKKTLGGPSLQDILVILLQLLEAVLEGDKFVQTTWKVIYDTADNASKQKAVWHEFLSLLAGGKVLGIAAEAEDVANQLSSKVGDKHWVANSDLYSFWVARNIVQWTKNIRGNSENEAKSCGELFSKSLRLGHTENLIKIILTSLVLEKDNAAQLTSLLISLPSFEQRDVIYSVLKIISKEYLLAVIITEDNPRWWKSDANVVSAAAGLVSLLMAHDGVRKSFLIAWLTNPSGAGIGESIAIRRAVVASLAQNTEDIESVLDKSLKQFGDQLYVKHTPTLQQEVHTQVLLLSAGYVHRKAPLRLAMMMRSGAHISAVSTRLAASSPRARFLGMAVGEALSSLVDKGDKKMNFKVEEMNTAEAKWYKGLVKITDTVGALELLQSNSATKTPSGNPRVTKPVGKPKVPQKGSKIVAIEEIETDGEEGISDDDGLMPYGKPDSDVEDSDEDATLVTRNKPIAPVYIRDLITYLRDIENYDKQKLALATAASLIRRKASFGTEVSAHAEEIATLLVGLQDKYEIEDFQDMRIQGMIAILIAVPIRMGQWFSKTFFDGDYSLSQRASILTTLGIGARELAGYGAEDHKLTSNPTPTPSFPSKTLASTMHKLYSKPSTSSTKSLSTNAVDKLTTQLSNTILAPLATSLADKVSGPQILKVRTFSSRMSVEAARKKPIANHLAKVVSKAFFFPLTGRFFIHLKAYGSSRSNVIFEPFLLSLFIKTLALTLHASGPSTLSLPQMTSELWDLLLGLRVQGADILVMEALLFAFLTILEVNEDKRALVEAHGRQILETQEWVEGVFGRVGRGSEEEERVRMLAAGVLVRIRECVERYQALLMGDLASFQG